ncbi:hypothetical protein GOBAR_AA05087 [Gossypium barbadense]|uniref:Uncharacterized protein n=1 Tax=Gossypium barbadense TaxID=3634 RepID=A0A2P5YIR5_GOSBA|nr:hypothetical protein GOBAR_AA05087 [Gossypium barbadense]
MFVSSEDEGNEDTVSDAYAACDVGAFSNEQDSVSWDVEHCTGVKEPVTVECKELDAIDQTLNGRRVKIRTVVIAESL